MNFWTVLVRVLNKNCEVSHYILHFCIKYIFLVIHHPSQSFHDRIRKRKTFILVLFPLLTSTACSQRSLCPWVILSSSLFFMLSCTYVCVCSQKYLQYCLDSTYKKKHEVGWIYLMFYILSPHVFLQILNVLF